MRCCLHISAFKCSYKTSLALREFRAGELTAKKKGTEKSVPLCMVELAGIDPASASLIRMVLRA